MKHLNKYAYYRITKIIGCIVDRNGVERLVRKQFTGKNKAEAEAKHQAYLNRKNHYIVNHQGL